MRSVSQVKQQLRTGFEHGVSQILTAKMRAKKTAPEHRANGVLPGASPINTLWKR